MLENEEKWKHAKCTIKMAKDRKRVEEKQKQSMGNKQNDETNMVDKIQLY